MRAAGIDQWDDVYPSQATLLADVQARTMYLGFAAAGTLVGSLVLNEYENPEYSDVPWAITGMQVAVVHRLMVHPQYEGRGIARELRRRCARLRRLEQERQRPVEQKGRGRQACGDLDRLHHVKRKLRAATRIPSPQQLRLPP